MKLTKEEKDHIYSKLWETAYVRGVAVEAMSRDNFYKAADKIHQLIYDKLSSVEAIDDEYDDHYWQGGAHWMKQQIKPE